MYLSDQNGGYSESYSYCLLDFYVYHTFQRQGQGKILFDKMLRFLKINAYDIAYDSPNEKILNFLFKHYSLTAMIRQNNNYIVFKELFTVRI